jgi:hypothetical protein
VEHDHCLVALLEEEAGAVEVYLDLAEAINKVDHRVLIRKLRLLGKGGSLLG